MHLAARFDEKKITNKNPVSGAYGFTFVVLKSFRVVLNVNKAYIKMCHCLI